MNPEFTNADIFDNTTASLPNTNIQAQLRETLRWPNSESGTVDLGFKRCSYEDNDIYFITYLYNNKNNEG